MTLADRILILNRGQIEQFDTPKAIYRNPASVFVAKFIGSPPMNILPATGDGRVLTLGDGQVVAGSSHRGPCQLGIRPEDILVDAGDGTITGEVAFREDLGSHSVVAVKVGTETIRIATPFGADVDESPTIRLRFPHTRIHIFDPETGKAIAAGIESLTP